MCIIIVTLVAKSYKLVKKPTMTLEALGFENHTSSLQYHRMTRKGIRLIFLNQDGEIIAGWCFGIVQSILAVTQTSASTPSAEWGRVVFSF